MYFSYNGTRHWLKIEWRDQTYMKLQVVAKNTDKKNSVAFRSSLYAFDLWETGLYDRVSLAQIHFLLFLCDTSPAYEIFVEGNLKNI